MKTCHYLSLVIGYNNKPGHCLVILYMIVTVVTIIVTDPVHDSNHGHYHCLVIMYIHDSNHGHYHYYRVSTTYSGG